MSMKDAYKLMGWDRSESNVAALAEWHYWNYFIGYPDSIDGLSTKYEMNESFGIFEDYGDADLFVTD